MFTNRALRSINQAAGKQHDHAEWYKAMAFDLAILVSNLIYRKVSNIRRTLVGNNIVDHSDVDGASPVGAAPTTSSFST